MVHHIESLFEVENTLIFILHFLMLENQKSLTLSSSEVKVLCIFKNAR